MQIDVAKLLSGSAKKIEFSFPVNTKLNSDILDIDDLKVDGVLTNKKGCITFSGVAETTFRVYCARCLKVTNSNLAFEFEDKFISANVEKPTDDEYELYVYDGGFIDVTDSLCANIFLNLPYKVVCSESCKGLCKVCGADLNVTQCECDTSFGNVFSGLSEFFNK